MYNLLSSLDFYLDVNAATETEKDRFVVTTTNETAHSEKVK